MENNSRQHEEKDPVLWAIAKKRAAFKKGLVTYIVINAFLWFIWFLSNYNSYQSGIPWPVWPTAGWGIAIVMDYFSAYRFPHENTADKEYRKLKEKEIK